MATDVELSIGRKYRALRSGLNELMRRRWAGAEAEAIGWGGVALVARATGIAIKTVRRGRDELRAAAPPRPSARAGVSATRSVEPEPPARVRREGGGRPRLEKQCPEILDVLEALVDPVTRGDPESPLRWTCKSTQKLADELCAQGFKIGKHKVAMLLRAKGYSLQGNQKTIEGTQHPDRNAQFEFLNERVAKAVQEGLPAISVDTKKKELVGNFSNRGREWQPEGEPVKVLDHDFPSDALGKAIPYGVYDIANNSGWVTVGTDHDTPAFAVRSIETWWKSVGSKRYPGARELLITADAGGSNGHRPRLWKLELQRLSDKLGIAMHVSHFPPGTSKWNKIEHRLFSFITQNWRGRPLTTYETVVELISATTTSTGLTVEARIDRRGYPLGVKVSNREMRTLNIERDEFHGDWNYTIRPRVQPQ